MTETPTLEWVEQETAAIAGMMARHAFMWEWRSLFTWSNAGPGGRMVLTTQTGQDIMVAAAEQNPQVTHVAGPFGVNGIGHRCISFGGGVALYVGVPE